jgi:two-component system osmolarity sensor histidine kinase EnvZ
MDQIAPEAMNETSAPRKPRKSWLDPDALERVMPRTLMARVSVTIVVPLILVQIISTYVFYGNLWNTMARRMAADLAGDIGFVAQALHDAPDQAQRDAVTRNAQANMELQISFAPDVTLTGAGVISAHAPGRPRLEQELWSGLQRPFAVDFLALRSGGLVSVRVQETNGVLTVLLPRARIFSNNTTLVFVVWMVGSSMLLFGVATAYLRNQVATVRRLARAADAFGKGREVADFPDVGAFEVRQAARAFNIMRGRIQRQIAQRTEMLAGVSHDLRTPLTRMKLQLEMMPNTQAEDIAALREDVVEMERMLDAYLAFARGEGTEPPAQTDLGELVETIVARFRREGADITLHKPPTSLAVVLKPVAYDRSLSNLIGNAMRYARGIVVTAHRVGEFVHVDVDDDGPGIRADRREEAFRAFHRLEPSRNPKTGGVGLGLTIARDIVRGMGGDIVLGDSPMGGLRASLRVPV